jgi:hypothetical protein
MTTTAQIVKVAKDLFEATIKKAATAYITGIMPFFAIPVLSTFLSKVLDLIIGKASDSLEMAGFFVYTDIRTSRQGKAYFDAKIKGYELELTGTPEQKKAAEDEIKKAFIAFASFTS